MVIFIKKLILIIKLLTIISFSLFTIFIFYKTYYDTYYHKELLIKENKIVYGTSAPRGRILDKNGNILVDNKTVNNLVFHYIKGMNRVEIAKIIADIFQFDNPSEASLIEWYKANNDEYLLLTKGEQTLRKERKITEEQLNSIIKDRIVKLIDNYDEYEKNCASIYNIITNGYDYEDKILIKNISNENINLILNKNIEGLTIKTSYERYYPYGELLKSIFGNIGKISFEDKEYFLNIGYSLNDVVGISNLEKQYEYYLKGTKAKYLVNSDNSLTLLEEEKKGNDLVLSIDIELQEKIETIVKEELSQAKKYPNTKYLNDTYVIISNPNTGEILSMVGQRYIKDNVFNDITLNNINSSFTMGSSVKGATISVGYKYNLIDSSKLIYDSCVKLKNLTQKCSHKELGYLNAITALEQSSNYYQFLIAIKLLGYDYTPDMELTATYKEFKIYRDMLSSYGLGTLSGIDLPNEKNGIIGNTISADLLLNLAIGQYDTYTPVQLMTYINTLANNGNKRKLSLVNSIKNNNKVLYKNKHQIINEVDITKDNIKLIQEGFYYVMNRGTGLGFMNKNINPAGKTGTSESFLDTNNDGKIDTKTLSLTMVGYFPYDNPKYSMVVISPHTSYNNPNQDYIYYITSKISRKITNLIEI